MSSPAQATLAAVREQAKKRAALARASVDRSMKSRAAKHPALERARARRARRRQRTLAAIAVLLLLLLLLQRCEPDEAPAPAPIAEVVARPAPPPAPAPPRRPTSKVRKQPRPPLKTEDLATPPWLSAFRLQVASRSTRLARCFSGVERPGALRWSALVDAGSGAVSEQALDAVDGVVLTGPQRDCLQGVLAEPPYRLTPSKDDEHPLPARVSLVVEF